MRKFQIGYQQINMHMIFDIKVGILKRKAYLAAGGHMTETPTAMTYAKCRKLCVNTTRTDDSSIEWLGSTYC
jgi:hypothetical protein